MLFSEPKIPQFARLLDPLDLPAPFQCSSASRKFLNISAFALAFVHPDGFSALQRAENSSIRGALPVCAPALRRFSALQRAENSSIQPPTVAEIDERMFQCSSASRKFLNGRDQYCGTELRYVSVLFTEPKIPQYPPPPAGSRYRRTFQCSSASRKFLNGGREP